MIIPSSTCPLGGHGLERIFAALEDEVEIFRNSDFYKNILQLAQSAELNNYLKTKGYYLEIYLHKLMHRYMRRIKSEAELSNITFLSEKTDVQYQILKSKLLITDYSSVFFDFLFLDKPVIFYQFDYEKYYQHIPGSYISKERLKPCGQQVIVSCFLR